MDNNLINNILQPDSRNLIRGGTGNSYAPFELKLQLHGQVNNPYTVSVKNGYNVSSEIDTFYGIVDMVHRYDTHWSAGGYFPDQSTGNIVKQVFGADPNNNWMLCSLSLTTFPGTYATSEIILGTNNQSLYDYYISNSKSIDIVLDFPEFGNNQYSATVSFTLGFQPSYYNNLVLLFGYQYFLSNVGGLYFYREIPNRSDFYDTINDYFNSGYRRIYYSYNLNN